MPRPEDHPNFITWANEPDDRGWRYLIRYRSPFPGYGWAQHRRELRLLRRDARPSRGRDRVGESFRERPQRESP